MCRGLGLNSRWCGPDERLSCSEKPWRGRGDICKGKGLRLICSDVFSSDCLRYVIQKSSLTSQPLQSATLHMENVANESTGGSFLIFLEARRENL